MANNLPTLAWRAKLFIGLLLATSLGQAAENYKEFRRDHWDVELGAEYFRSDSNYSSGGNSEALSGSHYQLLDTYFFTRYTPKRNFSLFALANVGTAESQNNVATRTNSTINQMLLGTEFVAYSEFFQVIPEVAVLIPLEKIDTGADDVLNSEGVLEVRSRLVFQKDLGTVRPYGWLGFTYRGEGRSFLMPWGVGTQVQTGRWRWGAEIFGYQSVTDDTVDQDVSSRSSFLDTVNAGSLKFYGRNPSLFDSQVYATWLVTKSLSLQIQGGTTLSGANTAAGFHAGGFIRYTFDLTEGYREEPYIPVNSPVPSGRSNMNNSKSDQGLSSERKVRQFREETDDGVDQDLFRPRPTKRPRVNDKKLQQQLDDTEMQIELRSKKNRKRSR